MKKITIAFAGNPNVGKSTVFNYLTGLRQHTGNWAGKTVDLAYGSTQRGDTEFELIDLPGCYSLLSGRAEEETAREFILSGNADAVCVVCDATCLERNLNLVLQVLHMTKKAIICVNLMDEAERKGIKIDIELLSEILGVPAIAASARQGTGIDAILDIAEKGDFEEYEFTDKEFNDEIAEEILKKSAEIASEVIQNTKQADISKADRILTSRALGYPVMLVLLAFILWFTISGANYPSDILSRGFFFIEDKLAEMFGGTFLSDMLIHGLYRVMAWVVSVMLPPMAIFFPLFTLLEDLGYLPRVAFNLDNTLKKCHACGKQALTMCMGFGCNAVGVSGTKIIDSPRERLIAILTNNFVPCNGRFPTLISIITMFFIAGAYPFAKGALSALLLTAVILLGILMTFAVSWLLSKTFLKGEASSVIIELPPFRKPQIGKVIVRSLFDRTVFVLGRAVAVAAPTGIVIFLLANIFIGDLSVLTHISRFLDPFARLFGLDGVILMAFILGLPANEIVVPIIIMSYTASTQITDLSSLAAMHSLFAQNGWTMTTAVCTMVFCLMHWPCSTTLLTIKKETKSIKWTALSFALPTVCGLAICFLINLIF